MGDSHVSGRTEFEEKRVRTGTKIRGACKPGGGLLDVSPTCSPPPDQCYVLMVGTNNVDDGREGVISSNLESLLTSCKVLLIPLTPRYDLSPVHDTICPFNNFMAVICYRHNGGVELFDTSNIGRQHYTPHGLHLQASRKRLLTNLIERRLANKTLLPPQPFPEPGAEVRAPASPVIPSSLQFQTYAEATAQPVSFRSTPTCSKIKPG
ncbi:hypothetical protein J6590_047727 [Homalodisca vitripennis]|nr:hypothetical protein J6590_047727 [Homalodisca vitripennis]